MRLVRFWILVIALLCSVGTASCTPDRTAKTPTADAGGQRKELGESRLAGKREGENMPDTQEQAEGPTFQVSLPAKVVQGDPCEAELVLTNSRDAQRVILCPRSDKRDIGVRLFDSNRVPVTLTRYGESVLTPVGGDDISAGFVPLAPGESHRWTVDLAKCFDLKPGRYTATVTISHTIVENPAQHAPSKEVAFEVLQSK